MTDRTTKFFVKASSAGFFTSPFGSLVMLQVDNLDKVYDTGDHALREVTFEVRNDEFVSVIGPSGAGKSTLVRCINRLVEPTGGRVVLDGTNVTALSKGELRKTRRKIGMVFQEFSLVERLTVMENVLSGRLGYVSSWRAFRRKFPNSDIERAYELLERMGLEDFEDKRVDALSGGQRQRVGIARALIQKPKILLVDEPTSSLDPETSNTVMDLLAEVGTEEDIPILINLHDVDHAIKYSDRIIGLNNGSKVFEGPPNEIDDEQKDIIYQQESLDRDETGSVEPSQNGDESALEKIEKTLRD